jgi:hypothetical protein
MLMLGIDHDENQWWHGDNIASYDVSMVLGAEAPCTHVMYSLVNMYDENDLIIQDGSSLIEFQRLRQVDIDALYVTLADPEDFVTFSPVPEIAILKENGIKLNKLPKVMLDEWTWYYTLTVTAMSNTHVASRSYEGSITVPAQCMPLDVDISEMKSIHRIDFVADVTGKWTPEGVNFGGACNKYAFAFAEGTNKNLELSKTGRTIRYPKGLKKNSKKYRVELIVSVWGKYGTVITYHSTKIKVPSKNDARSSTQTDYDVPT